VASADFRRLWAEHEVAVRRVAVKTLLHPRAGRLRLDCETLVTPDLSQQLLVLTPADAESRERVELLGVLGTEEFPASTAGW
ncbi:transcriptional regulator, partial [Actinosynnema sp. NPDC023658]